MELTEVKIVINSKSENEDGTSLQPEVSPRLCEIFHKAVELIGRRWTGAVVQVMLGGAERFSDIRGAIPGISDRLLAERLKELESEGVVSREVQAGRPPQVAYRLTEKGRGLSPVLDSISEWAHRWPEGHPNLAFDKA